MRRELRDLRRLLVLAKTSGGRQKVAHVAQRDQVTIVPSHALEGAFVGLRLCGVREAVFAKPFAEARDVRIEILLQRESLGARWSCV